MTSPLDLMAMLIGVIKKNLGFYEKVVIEMIQDFYIVGRLEWRLNNTFIARFPIKKDASKI